MFIFYLPFHNNYHLVEATIIQQLPSCNRYHPTKVIIMQQLSSCTYSRTSIILSPRDRQPATSDKVWEVISYGRVWNCEAQGSNPVGYSFFPFSLHFWSSRQPVFGKEKGWKTSEVQHFFSEPTCNWSIVPPAHFTLCPKLDIQNFHHNWSRNKWIIKL